MEELKELLEKRKAFEAQIILRALEDKDFRMRLKETPSAAVKEALGMDVPEGLRLKVVEEEPRTVTLVIPELPEDLELSSELSEEALQSIAGGGNVGVSVAAVTSDIVIFTAIV